MSKHRQHRMAARFGWRLRTPGSVRLTITVNLATFVHALNAASEALHRFRFANLSNYRQREAPIGEGAALGTEIVDETNIWKAK